MPLNHDASSTFPRWPGRWSIVIFISVCVLAIWSTSVSEFVASSLGQRLSLMAAAGVGALMGVWTYVDPVYARDTPERAARLARAPVMASPVVRMLFVGAFMGWVTFEAVSGAVLEFWTLAFGRPAEQTLHLGDYYRSSRSNCAGFELQEAPLKLRRVVCARYRDGEAPAPGTPVTVRGRASTVGIEVEQFQISPGE